MTAKTTFRDSFIYNTAMFLFSFSVMALETIFMHQLLIITNYLTATYVIAIAMIGIAMGGFISFYLARIKGYFVMFIASLLFMASIPLSYYNIIRIGEFDYPYFLVLPFFFSAIIISILFARGNSNRIYFTNLVASAAGVIFPIFSVSAIKSENSLILLLFVPAIFILSLVIGFRNIFAKIFAALVAIPIFFGTYYIYHENMKLPLEISKEDFETKIVPSIKSKFDKDFILSKYTPAGDKYLLSGSDYEKKRAKYILTDIGYNQSSDYRNINFWKNLDINYKIKCDSSNKINDRKVWCSQMKYHNWKVIFSEDDLMGKIDLFAIDDKNIFFCTNAIPLDTVDKSNGSYWDPRVPHIDNPKVFIIGLSYDGIVKSAKNFLEQKLLELSSLPSSCAS